MCINTMTNYYLYSQLAMTRSICFYTSSDLSGTSGNNIATKEMVKAFIKRDGLKTTLIAPKPKSTANNEIFNKVNEVHYLPKKDGNKYWWHIKTQPHIINALIKTGEADTLICRIDPSQILFPLFKKWKGTNHVLLIRGLTSLGVRSNHPISTILQSTAQINVNSADRIIVAYEEVVDQMRSLGWDCTNKTTVFPNAVDIDLFRHVPINQAREKTGLPFSNQDFVIGFVGSIRKRHQIAPLIQAVSVCRDQNKNVKLLIVGDGPQKKELESLCYKNGLDNCIKFTGQVPHNKVAQYISACDVLYGVVDPNHPTNPIKCYEYLACERPIITSRSPEFSFVNNNHAGIVMEEVSQKEITNAISNLYGKKSSDLRKMGKEGRSYVCRYHTWDKLVPLCIE